MKIIAEITPVPLGRTKINTQNKGRYLDAKSKKFKQDFQILLRVAFKQQPLTAPLALTLHFYKNAEPTSKTRYGDIDNLEKAVLDACNGILWLDDRQIVEMHSYKHKGTGKIILEVIENVD